MDSRIHYFSCHIFSSSTDSDGSFHQIPFCNSFYISRRLGILLVCVQKTNHGIFRYVVFFHKLLFYVL